MKDANNTYPQLNESINDLDLSSIPEERKAALEELIHYIQSKISANEAVRLNFICTHNSRRSHLSQIWAQTMANYFQLPNVYCYSGGTEATALYPKVIETLAHVGFQISTLAAADNSIYSIKYSSNTPPIIGFSKVLDHPFNPSTAFAAILTCDAANEACPFVAGTEKRIPLTYEDPKAFDNSPLQTEKYLERSVQIATEMFYVFNKINA